MDANETEYQYELLGGIGTSPANNDTPNGHAEQEEQFISLLDVIEDDNDGAPKLEQLETGNVQEPLSQNQDKIEFNDRPLELPWARSSRNIASPTLRLHNEIVAFCRFLEPTPAEDYARDEALQRITRLVTSMFPSAKIQLFGSYLTGLHLPTSDMDIVVTDSGCDDVPRALRAIGNALVEEGTGSNINVIASAKVPIVKFDDVATGLAFDISFDVANGPKAAEYVIKLIKRLPPMCQLVKILKLFLQQRELNEVYQGGIGSYALLVMVAAFLMQHSSRSEGGRHQRGELEYNLGILLQDFFRLFGRTLDYEHVVVSCRKRGIFYPKEDGAFLQRDKAYYLAVEDPQDPDNDLTKGSYNISRVQKAFDYAYTQLSSPIHPHDSALERIIRLDAVLMSRSSTEDTSAQDYLSGHIPGLDNPPHCRGSEGNAHSKSAQKKRRRSRDAHRSSEDDSEAGKRQQKRQRSRPEKRDRNQEWKKQKNSDDTRNKQREKEKSKETKLWHRRKKRRRSRDF